MKEKNAKQTQTNAVTATSGIMQTVKISHLYKKYDPKKDYAISDINFSCNEGEIVGLMGHNGAGKTTTIKCMTGMFPFEKGEIEICGHSIKTKPIEAKLCMGFVTDNHSVFLKMTGYQYLAFMFDVYRAPLQGRKERIEQLDSVFNLGSKALGNLIASYSHGMKQKVCMMGSLGHDPKVWILDEPMTGLDPETIKAVSQFVKSYAALGNTVLFSSHDVHLVASLCQKVVIFKHGVITKETTLS